MNNIIAESPQTINPTNLSQNKCYAIFNSSSFYIHGGGELKSLTRNEDILLTLSQLQEKIQNKGTHFVAECDNINAALDFYNSGLWRNYR